MEYTNFQAEWDLPKFQRLHALFLQDYDFGSKINVSFEEIGEFAASFRLKFSLINLDENDIGKECIIDD